MIDSTIDGKKVKVFQGINASIEQAARYFFKGHWVTIFTKRFRLAVRNLTNQQRIVFDVLIDSVGYNNLVRITHADIAELLNISANAVSKCIAALSRAGVISKHHDYVYEIDPGILWFGKRRDYFEPPENPSLRTHQPIEFFDRGKHVVTFHYPRVLSYNKYQWRYGRMNRRGRA